MKKIFAVVIGAGNASRFSAQIPKQFSLYNGNIIIRSVVKTFLSLREIAGVICVIPELFCELYNKVFLEFDDYRLLPPVFGGHTRKDSVRNGLEAISHLSPDYVLIHDAARANVTKELITKIIDSLISGERAVIPGISPTDSIRISGKSFNRDKVTMVQTPQGFDFKTIYDLHKKYGTFDSSDDAALCDLEAIDVKIIEGDINNKKITYKSDIETPEIKIGFGFDTHAFSKDKNRKLFLMGVLIDNHPGLDGVSDADVGIHSLVDAIIGALGKGSIGEHFPSSDPRYINFNSKEFLKYCHNLLHENNYKLLNCDITIVCESPNISRYVSKMKDVISEILCLEKEYINIKGKTTEGLGFTGRKEGISAYSNVLIKKLTEATKL